jgi:glycosyltransferase involved in cell wall biosynthesis
VPGRHLTIVLEQAAEQGGTERVVELVLRRHPDARVLSPDFRATNVPAESAPWWLERVEPFALRAARRRPLWAPRYARRIARAPLPATTELVLTFSGHGWALAAAAPTGVPHVSYVTGLPRSLYGEAARYRSAEPPLLRPALRIAQPLLRTHHAHLIRRADRVLTNSRASARDLAAAYGIEAQVVHPPVRTDFFTPAARPRRYALVVARLVAHKRVELAIEAARLAGLPVVVAGSGPQLERLRARSGPHAQFTGWVSDEQLRELYRGAVALVCPSVEEFGIVMAEAHACGTPVVAPRAGGALDIVADGVTGRLVEDTTARGFAAGLRHVPCEEEACRRSGARFGEERFIARLRAELQAAAAASTASAVRASGSAESTAPAAVRAAALAYAHAEASSSDRTAAT